MSDFSSSNEDENKLTRYESDEEVDQSEDNTLRNRRSNKDFEKEESFASQIQSRNHIQDEVEQIPDDVTSDDTFTSPTEDVPAEPNYRSKTEWILLFIIACICISYTVGVYMSISVGKQYRKPEFNLQWNEEFRSKMLTKELGIPFYVKRNYQPKNKEELERLWSYVESEWRMEGRT